MLNLDFEMAQDIVVLFIVVILLGAIAITYWADRAERKAERKRMERKRMREGEEQKETRRAA